MGPHEAIFNLCHQASLAWLGVPRRSKVLASDPGVQIISGGWALAPAFGYGSANTIRTTTPGTVRFMLQTAGGPAYLWYVIETGTSGSFTVSVDGNPAGAQQSVQPAASIGNVLSSIGMLRLPVLAGNHTFDITALSGSVEVLAMGSAVSTGSRSPAVLAGDVPLQLNTGHNAAVAKYASDAQANIEQLIADGLNVAFVPTHSYMKATPAEIIDGIHPTPLGLTHLAQAFEAAVTPAMVTQSISSFATASLSTSQLTTGNSTIVMNYSGDRNNPPTSTALHLYLYDGSSALTVVPSTTTLAPGAALVLTTSVTPVLATGYITLVDLVSGASVPLGGSWLDLPVIGSATQTLSNLAPGAHSLQANYTGDISFNGSSSPLIKVVVLAQTSTNLTASSGTIRQGAAVTLTAIVTPKGATGSLQILDGGTLLGTVPLSGTIGTYTTSSLALGAHALSAAYDGDSLNTASTSSVVMVNVVSPTSTTLTFSNPGPHTYGDPNFLLVAASNSPAPITYSVVSGPAILAGASIQITGAGTVTLSASQPATGIFNAGVSGASFVVQAEADSVRLLVSSANAAFGSSVKLQASVLPALAGLPGGSVTFLDGGVPLVPSIPLNGPSAELTMSTLAPGVHVLTASYGGDSRFLMGVSTTISISIQALDFSLSNAGSTSQSITAGQSATMKFLLSPIGGIYPGTVTLSVSGLPPGATGALSTSSVANTGGDQTIVLTVDTASTFAHLYSPKLNLYGRRDAEKGLAWAMMLPLFFLILPRRRIRVGSWRLFLLLVSVASTGLALTAFQGCGSATNQVVHTSGTYAVMVTGTSGGISHSATSSLTLIR